MKGLLLLSTAESALLHTSRQLATLLILKPDTILRCIQRLLLAPGEQAK